MAAIRDIVDSYKKLKDLWETSTHLIPDFQNHFTLPVSDMEIESRIRLLVVGEAYFIHDEIERVLKHQGTCSYADVGDSDGSVRQILRQYFEGTRLQSVGINLQRSAVDKMNKSGLEAICADALSLGEQGITYDIVSAFETLEHLPDPIGFLTSVKKITHTKLILSVPFIRRSRVGLAYTSSTWPEDKTPTIENTHIFELSPADWRKIFLHTGWNIEREWTLLMYHPRRAARVLLQPYWRRVSFEGFWFVALSKDDTFTSRYKIE